MVCDCTCHKATASRSQPETICHLDAEIERTMQHLQALRYRRNMLSPVSRLPREIVSLILTTLKGNCSPIEWRLELCAIPRVCHAWRLTAHSCPSLWTCINFCNKGLAIESMFRAGNLPLKIHIETFKDDISCALELIPRARSLSIRWSEEDSNYADWVTVSRFLSIAQAPYVQSLVFYGDEDFLDGDDTLIPTSDNTPNLARLTFVNVTFHCKQLEQHCNLKVLFMDNIDLSPIAWLTFRNMLSQFAQLEVLVLRDSCAGNWFPILEYPLLDLPSLEFLEISDFFLPMVQMFAKINLGPRTRLRLVSKSTPIDQSFRLAMMTKVADHAKATAATLPLHILSAKWDDLGYALTGSSDICMNHQPAIDLRTRKRWTASTMLHCVSLESMSIH
jgi:hypothetical protein